MTVTLMMMLNFRIRPPQVGVSATFVPPAERRPKPRQLFARAAHAQCIENDVKSIIAGARGDARVGAATSNSGRRDRLPRFHMALTVAAGRCPTVHSLASAADDPPAIIRDVLTHLLPVRGNSHLDLVYRTNAPVICVTRSIL